MLLPQTTPVGSGVKVRLTRRRLPACRKNCPKLQQQQQQQQQLPGGSGNSSSDSGRNSGRRQLGTTARPKKQEEQNTAAQSSFSQYYIHDTIIQWLLLQSSRCLPGTKSRSSLSNSCWPAPIQLAIKPLSVSLELHRQCWNF